MTIRHGWGSVTRLEKNEAFEVSRLTLLPGRSGMFPADAHFTVAEGSAVLTAENATTSLGPKDTFKGTGTGEVNLRNPGNEPAEIIVLRDRKK